MADLEAKIEQILTDEDVEHDAINENVKQPDEAYRLNRLRTIEAIRLLIRDSLQSCVPESPYDPFESLRGPASARRAGIEWAIAQMEKNIERMLK